MNVMKFNIVYNFILILLLYLSAINGINVDQNFKLSLSKAQHNRCFKTNKENKIRILARVSMVECVSECGNRPECEAVNYYRRVKICQLLSSEEGDYMMNNGNTGPCVLVLKSDIAKIQTCNCAIGNVCENNSCLTKECSSRTQPENVEIVGNMNTIGSDILYTCHTGYINTGQESATCLTHGVWSDQPSCVIDCGEPTIVTGASRLYSSTILDSGVTYSCQTGYSHTDGDLQRYCGSDGNWDGSLPTCTVDCGEPPIVTGASTLYSSTILDSVVTYTCQTGYSHTDGDLQLICGMNGDWGGNLPTCTVDCGEPSIVSGASRLYSSTILDSVVTYSCQTGYSHTDGDLQRYCGSDGNWGGSLPTCTVDCGSPMTASGSSKSYTATTEGSTVTYTCFTGNILISGNLQRVCGNNGLWSGTSPECVPGCSELPTVPNSNVSPGGLTQGTERTFTCTSGKYFATGVTSLVAICLSGVWSNIDTICPRDSSGAACPGCGILRDCEDVQSLGMKTTGTYLIHPAGNTGISVRCDMDTTSGGWTVIQRRISSSDFYRTWNDYKNGFGDVGTNYWLGNDNIANLMGNGNYKIRFDLYTQNNDHAYAEYSTFKIADESQSYKLTVSGYSGTAGDSLSVHNGQQFTTKDNDNDPSDITNCAILYTGAWWYEACHDSNLNGMYGSSESGKGIIWYTLGGTTNSLIKTEMKIKRK